MDLKDYILNNAQSDSAREDVDSDGLETQKILKALEAMRYQADTDDRRWLAKWSAVLVSVWLVGVLFLIAFNFSMHLGLSDTVLVTLLGTTTLNVLGLPLIVLKGHFERSK